jgi:hypothetical protein
MDEQGQSVNIHQYLVNRSLTSAHVATKMYKKDSISIVLPLEGRATPHCRLSRSRSVNSCILSSLLLSTFP